MNLANSTPVPPVGRPQPDDLGTRVWYTDDGIQEVALQERAALDFETELNEERGHPIEVGHRDSDMIETSTARHGRHPARFVRWRHYSGSAAHSSAASCGLRRDAPPSP